MNNDFQDFMALSEEELKKEIIVAENNKLKITLEAKGAQTRANHKPKIYRKKVARLKTALRAKKLKIFKSK